VAEPAAPLKLCGLAVTDDHYLIVGTVDPAGLLIFDLYGGGSPLQSQWPGHFTPFDMASVTGGGILILDRDNREFWALDRTLRACSGERTPAEEDFFQSPGGYRRLKPEETLPRGISLQEGSPALDVIPIAIESLPDGTVLILERIGQEPYSRISRYSLGGECRGHANLTGGTRGDSYHIVGHDIAFMPEQSGTNVSVQGRLYVADKDGNQTMVFTLTCSDTWIDIELRNEYLPMRLFGGKGLVRCGAQVFYDFSSSWIPLIRQNRPRYSESATLLTPPFDGREPDCVWHRFLLDAAIPSETGVQIWSRAANRQWELHSADWMEEPVPYRRGSGSELPFVQMAEGIDSWEFLFQAARGRYLQLKIVLSGNGRATPRLRSLRAYYPRFSYRDHYLPAIYRGDTLAENYEKERLLAEFLDRFLANMEGIYTALEDRIAAAEILFDPVCTPPEALDWLAGWFGISLDPSWDERRQRLFIRYAMDFFNCRGTIRGLQMALHLALDECVDEFIFTDTSMKSVQQSSIRIVERFRTRRTPGVVLGDPTSSDRGPVSVTPTGLWTPDQTGEELGRRYSLFLADQTASGLKRKVFPITMPAGVEEAGLWQSFSLESLGFIPSAGSSHLPLWQNFLARRYRTIAECNRRYSAVWSSFDTISLPDALPEDGAPLQDWYQFESVVLPMRRNAHQFTVLLPTPKSETADSAEYQRRLQLARRIVELEKPAHTTFSVNFYWAMFRVGEARVGYDTVVDLGSRAPEFMAAMVLGKQHMGESFIGTLQPQLQDRTTLGETGLN
jgi:phage tail-like protein